MCTEVSLSERSSLVRVVPFLDPQGLFRVGNKLRNSFPHYDEKHAIILPGSGVLVRRMVEKVRKLRLHGVVLLMLSHLRRSFWIIRGVRLVRGVYRRCVRCVRFAAQPLSQQIAPLPAIRTLPQRRFARTGLDYAGPFPVLFSKGRGAEFTKGSSFAWSLKPSI